ncbi:hypothetical protein [Roseofilum sp. Guam]|nr:hypothetical protein [Roseofilum sp. Guam]
MKPQSASILDSAVNQKRRNLSWPKLPLAVYREVAAHLRQIDGVNTGLYSQSSSEFNYYLSQVGSMWLEYPEDLGAEDLARIDQILAYYSDRYGVWKSIDEN